MPVFRLRCLVQQGVFHPIGAEREHYRDILKTKMEMMKRLTEGVE